MREWRETARLRPLAARGLDDTFPLPFWPTTNEFLSSPPYFFPLLSFSFPSLPSTSLTAIQFPFIPLTTILFPFHCYSFPSLHPIGLLPTWRNIPSSHLRIFHQPRFLNYMNKRSENVLCNWSTWALCLLLHHFIYSSSSSSSASSFLYLTIAIHPWRLTWW